MFNSKLSFEIKTKSQYIDFDVLELIKEFKKIKVNQKNITCYLIGFKEVYGIDNTHNVLSEAQTSYHNQILVSPKPAMVTS